MTYTPNTPQATQTIAFTQPLIESNFTYLEDAIERDHAWQGNIIGTEAPGRHQKVSMPNQGSDIVALPTGCSTVEYSIGGNKYMWNGAKRPISGVSGRGTIGLTTSFQTIFTVPAECIGWVSIKNSLVLPYTTTFHFFTSAAAVPTEEYDQPYQLQGSSTLLSFAITGGNAQIARTSGSNYTAEFKYIYWPI